jgi:hypothetical protein
MTPIFYRIAWRGGRLSKTTYAASSYLDFHQTLEDVLIAAYRHGMMTMPDFRIQRVRDTSEHIRDWIWEDVIL